MRIAAIVGATGTQGSSVLNAVLKDGTFTPRVITRNPNSTAGKVLKERGIEVVKGHMGDKDSLRVALKRSEVVFGMTNFWDSEVFPGTPEAEIEQGKNLVDAAKDVGVKFFVWSGAPNATTASGGKYSTVYHFDNKAIVWEYLLASGIPAANVYTGWFCENLWKMGCLVSAGAGVGYTIPIRYSEKSTQSVTWIERDLGPSVVALFKNYDSADVAKAALVVGKVLPVVTAVLTYPELAEKISAATGKPVAFEAIYTHGVEELDVMFDYQSEFGLYKDTPVPNPDLIALGVQISTLDEFLEEEVVKRF